MIWVWASAAAGPLERGQFEVVVDTMNTALVKHPGAPGLLTRRGIAESRAGRYHTALDTFDEVLGTAYYEARGVRDHADALRGLGRCAEAAELRTGAALTSGNDRVWVEVIDDWMACGDLARAEDAVYWALAFDPTAPAVHAAWADLLRLQGDAAGAEFELTTANRAAPTEPRVLLAYARWCVAARDLRCAAERADLLATLDPRDPDLFVVQLEVWMGTRRWLEAGATCARPEWSDHESAAVQAACARARAPRGAHLPPQIRGLPGLGRR